MKSLYRKRFWDLGGNLNEIDPPGEIPEKDVIECESWKVHEDGKSRVKRPGCTKLDADYNFYGEAIRGIQEYKDPDNHKKINVITERGIWQRKGTISFTRTFLEGQALYETNLKKLFIFDDKLAIIKLYDGTPNNAVQIYVSTDGSSFLVENSASSLDNVSLDLSAKDAIVFNGSVWIALGRDSGYSSPGLIYKYTKGTGWSTQLTSHSNLIACSMASYKNRLWVLTYDSPSGNDLWRVHYLTPPSTWAEVTDFDGSANIDSNTTTLIKELCHRFGQLYVWDNDLYLFVTVYSSAKSDWTWQIWKLHMPLDTDVPKFNKIFDSADYDEKYAFASFAEFDGKLYVVGVALTAGGAYDSGNRRLYRSLDIKTWEVLQTQPGGGLPCSEVIFDGRLYYNLRYPPTGSETSKISTYWTIDEGIYDEGLISTNPSTQNSGGMCVFRGDLFIGKWKEIYKREINSYTWTKIYESEQMLKVPSDGVVYKRRQIVGGFESNLLVEGDKVFLLGIKAPLTAPSVAVGSSGNLTGKYKYLITFYRTGNYPCESNPSPESAEVTPSAQKVDLTNIPVSPDGKVNARRIYRTLANGEKFYWLADITNNDATAYEDNLSDADILESEEVSYNRGIPKEGKFFEIWDGKLWIAGNEEFPNDLFRTNAGTLEEAASTNIIPVERREADKIKQIRAYGEDLYVFKDKTNFKVEKKGDNLYEINALPQGIGLEAAHSVEICDLLMIWKSDFGIEVFNGEMCFRPIMSRFIKRTLGSINRDFIDRCVSGSNREFSEYWLSIPTGSNEEPDKVVVFDYLGMRFSIYTFPKKMTAFATISGPNNERQFISGTDDGNIYIQNSGHNDDGSAISSNFSTPWINVSTEKELWNILRKMFIRYILPTNKTITMNIYRDFKKDAIATISLPGSTPSTTPEIRNEIMKRIALRVSGYDMRFEFINNEDTGGECRIIGFSTYFHRRLPKRSVKAD